MKSIGFEHATAIITKTVHDHAARNPYFFIVGAGVSIPAIPSAAKIIELCAATYMENSARFPGFPASRAPIEAPLIDQYSYWLSNAFPNSRDLTVFLTGIVEKAPITPANLRLAHLLMSGKISRTCFTTNFDNLLTRAMDLFGGEYVVCDHPRTTQRIGASSSQTQVVHIHGTYRFYDCVNLKSHIERRAADDDSSGSSSMNSLIRQFLAASSPIVIGYGGWEEDVFMSAFRRRLTDPLPFQALWFLYDAESHKSLPQWLLDSDDVLFVSNAADEWQDTDHLVAASGESAAALGSAARGAEVQPMLEARTVFEGLIRALDIAAPELTTDPLAFLIAKIRAAEIPPAKGARTNDIYNLESIMRRVEHARRLEFDNRSEMDNRLESIRTALRESDPIGVITKAESMLRFFAGLSSAEAEELFDAVVTARQGVPAEYKYVADQLTEKLSATIGSAGYEVARLWSRISQANHLKLRGEKLRASQILSETADQDADSLSPPLKEAISRAQLDLADILETEADGKVRARQLRAGVRDRYADARAPDESRLEAEAMYDLARTTSDHDQRRRDLREVAARFGASGETAPRSFAVYALCKVISDYRNAGLLDDTLASCDELTAIVAADAWESAIGRAYLTLDSVRQSLRVAGRVVDAERIAAMQEQSLLLHPKLRVQYRARLELDRAERAQASGAQALAKERYQSVVDRYKDSRDGEARKAAASAAEALQALAPA